MNKKVLIFISAIVLLVMFSIFLTPQIALPLQDFWAENNINIAVYLLSNPIFFIIILISTIVFVITLFEFKKRKKKIHPIILTTSILVFIAAIIYLWFLLGIFLWTHGFSIGRTNF